MQNIICPVPIPFPLKYAWKKYRLLDIKCQIADAVARNDYKRAEELVETMKSIEKQSVFEEWFLYTL